MIHTFGGKPITNILFRKIRPVFGTLSSVDNFVSSKNCNFRLFVITVPLYKFNIVKFLLNLENKVQNKNYEIIKKEDSRFHS